MYPFLRFQCETLLQNNRLMKDLKAKEYDLAIVDVIWNECSIGYARQVLNIPIVVGFWGIAPKTMQPDSRVAFPMATHQALNNPFVDSHNPYLERAMHLVLSLLNQVVMIIYHSFIHEPMRKYVPDTLSANELLQGLDAVLINTDQNFEVARLLPPNHVYIGGMQIERDTQNLQKLSEVR